MNTYPFPRSIAACVIAGALLGHQALLGADEAKPTTSKDTDALPVFDNYITVGGTATSLSGAKPAFQARTKIAKQGSAGIEELAYTYELSKATTLQIDGKAMPGAENYLLQFKLTKNEVGSIEAGYKQFRTFYDGAGGFFPLNNAWLPLYPRALAVDRSKFFINATVALPKAPVFTFRYANDRRTGRKDSTIWGDTDQTGVPIYSLSTLNPISADRKIIPAYIDLNERQETWEASVRHTVGKVTALFNISGNRIDNLDTRSIWRYPNEVKPFPAIPSNPVTLVPALLANNQNKGFDRQGFRENGNAAGGRIDAALNEKVTVFVSGNFRHADIDIVGSRLITGSLATAVGVIAPVGSFTSGGRPPTSYNSLGQLKTETLVGNLGVETKLLKDLRVDVAVRAEDYKTSGYTLATYVNNLVVPATGAVTEILATVPNSYKITERPWTPQVDVRYTGIKNVALFALWDLRTSPSDERTTYTSAGASGALIVPSTTLTSEKAKEKHSNLKVGANWTVSPKVTLRGEFFTKDHENNFDGYGASIGNFYRLDYDIYGARVSAVVKPIPTLGFNTRYIVQRGKGTVMADGYVSGDSNDTRRYEIAETVDWNPNKTVYVQTNVNLVYDQTVTAYPRAGGTANDVLHNADNNYWNGSVLTGFVIDKRTDAQVQATYYRANNYNAALAAATDPYGQGVRDYSVTFGVTHKFTDRLLGTTKIGYLNSDSDTTGGFSNYKGLVGFASLTYRL